MPRNSKELMEKIVAKVTGYVDETPEIDPNLKKQIMARVIADFTEAGHESFNDIDLVEDRLSKLMDDYPILEQKLLEIDLIPEKDG